MTLIHDRDGYWPGFGYSDEEKAELRSMAAPVPGMEYGLWLASVAVLFIFIAAVVVTAGMSYLFSATGGSQNSWQNSEPVFFLALALQIVVCLCIGMPAAMLPSAGMAGWLFTVADSDLPDGATTAHYFHKLWFQITRLALVAMAGLIPIWIFVPADSKWLVFAKLVVPLLSPAVSALTAAYYFLGRSKARA